MANLGPTNIFGDLVVTGRIKSRRHHAQFTSTDTSTDINTSSEVAIPWDKTVLPGAGYTVENNTEIVVQRAGLYQVFVSLSFDSDSTRVNPGIAFRVNGTTRNARGLSGYIRLSSGHDQASNTLSELLDLQKGDRVEVISTQMGNAGIVTLRAEESVLTFVSLD